MALILKDLQEAIGTLTLNNPEKRNCLSKDLLGEFIAGLKEMESEKARVIIIRAPKGSKVWSSGFNIKDFPEPGRDPLSYNDPLEEALRAIQICPAPVIAMVEGSVWGGACDLIFTCDLVIGDETATFAITPAKLGVPYTTSGLMHFINTVGMHIAKEMFFTAQPISAQRALEVGILNQQVPSAELDNFTHDLAKNICRNSPLSISVMKEQLRVLGNSHPISPETFERIQGLRRKVYDSQDFLEGRLAFFEKRSPLFTGN